VICFTESLSVQDLLEVGSASAREGLRRTFPRSEKKPRPWRDCVGGESFDRARL
jgi:hypothetical protein